MAHDFKRFPELTNRQMQFYYFQSPHKQITEDFLARVVKVTDGDTIRVTTDFRDFNFPIRLSKIAAPELDEGGGEKSRSWLESQIMNEDVEILIDKNNRIEKWGRLLGEIIHRGININNLSITFRYSVPFSERKGGSLQDFDEVLKAKRI